MQLAKRARERGRFPQLVNSEWSDKMGVKQNKGRCLSLTSPPHMWWQITKLGKAWDGWPQRSSSLAKERGPERQKGLELQKWWWQRVADEGSAWTTPRVGIYGLWLASIQSIFLVTVFPGGVHQQDVTTSLTCELAPSNRTLVTPTPVLGMCVVLAFLLIGSCPRTQPWDKNVLLRSFGLCM